MHTDYSLLDSATSYTDYISCAKSLGHTAIGFSEHGNVKGWVRKKMACDEAGLKFIPACEVYLTRSLLQNVDGESEPKKVRDNYHTVLIAKNYAGFLELNTLVSMSTDESHMYYTGRITFDEFLRTSDNIISTSACLASPLNKLSVDDPYYEKLAKKYTFYEIQHHDCQDQIAYNRHLAELAQKYHKPLIAGTDSHSISKYKDECRDILLLYKGQHYDGEDDFDLVSKSYEELCEAYERQQSIPESMWKQAIENTNVMAGMVESWDVDTSLKYPILYGSAENDREAYINNVNESFESKSASGVIPADEVEGFRNSIPEEIRVFSKIEMCGFMQSMSEIIRWCHDNGIVTGAARGSVGGSRTAYLTDIIDVDPERWQTVFSRFANEDRKEVGDIDVDVIESDRPRIFQYIIDRFGKERTARVPSFGTIQGKKAIAVIIGALNKKFADAHPGCKDESKPYYKLETRFKKEYEDDPEKFANDHEEVAYYLEGLIGVKESQSVHPAGIVISPVTLPDTYCTFRKDGYDVLQIDMEEIHEVSLVKFDFLVLENIGILKDAYSMAGLKYPKMDEVDWDDKAVWADMMRSPVGIFQMEGDFAFKLLKDFDTSSIYDMSLVTACIRPSGASYRNDLIARKPHYNPSKIIDDLLADNNGYLIYQEDTIKFLQQICGLSGSDADNIRRAIGRKDKERLQKALPQILNGYCSKSNQPREIAEQEAKEFIQILEDSASYQFGYNHSIAYCLIGYLCAWLRYYYPYQFITSYLNHASKDEDILNGTILAHDYGIKITPPKYGISSDQYMFDKEQMVIAKGISSIKFINKKCGTELYKVAHTENPGTFTDLMRIITDKGIADSRQMESLIKIDFFSKFGNSVEVSRIYEMFNTFGRSNTKEPVKQYKCDKVKSEQMRAIIEKYSSNLKKDGTPGTSYKFSSPEDVMMFLRELESVILSVGIEDVGLKVKCRNQFDVLGYVDIMTGKEEDRTKLYILNVLPLKDQFNGGVWKYKVSYRSIGSGKESSMFIFPRVYNNMPFKENDIIQVASLDKGGVTKIKGYWHISSYKIVV